jgi:hypothetical protein
VPEVIRRNCCPRTQTQYLEHPWPVSPSSHSTGVWIQLLRATALTVETRLAGTCRLELTASNRPKNDLSRLLMEGPSSFIEIAKFCVKNPQIKVDYIVRALSTHVNAPKHAILRSILFLRQGFWATWFFRRKDLRPMAHAVYFDRFDCFFELFTMENNGEPIVLPNAPNLRIRPADKVLSPNLALWLHMAVSDSALTPEQSRLCLELAEDWVKNGI